MSIKRYEQTGCHEPECSCAADMVESDTGDWVKVEEVEAALRCSSAGAQELRHENAIYRAKLVAVTKWLDENQPDVWRRGLCEALAAAEGKRKEAVKA